MPQYLVSQHVPEFIIQVFEVVNVNLPLDKKVKANGGRLKLSNIRPEIYEVFAITKLNKLFDIKDDETDALAAF